MSAFWILLELKDDRVGGGNWSNDVQSSSQVIITNKPPLSFLVYKPDALNCCPTNSVSTEGK